MLKASSNDIFIREHGCKAAHRSCQSSAVFSSSTAPIQHCEDQFLGVPVSFNFPQTFRSLARQQQPVWKSGSAWSHRSSAAACFRMHGFSGLVCGSAR